MAETIPAIFEQGGFRPLKPVSCKEGDRITLKVAQQDPTVSPESANGALDKIVAIAVNHEGDTFSGENHDEVLYPGEKPE